MTTPKTEPFSLQQLAHSNWTTLQLDSFLLKGDVVRRWANGMFSNNIRSLALGSGNSSAICDDRGRIMSFANLYCLHEQAFLCVLSGQNKAWFDSKFEMLMMLDDIETEAISTTVFHIFGETSRELLCDIDIVIPSEIPPNSVHTIEDVFVCAHNRFGCTGFDICCSSSEKSEQIRSILANKTSMISENAMESLRVYMELPSFTLDCTDKSFIHEVQQQDNLCAFNKGCYVGQEIINRMDIKGLVTKKLLRIEMTAIPSLPSTVIFEDKEQAAVTSIGHIIDTDGKNRFFALATLRKELWAPNLSVTITMQHDTVTGHIASCRAFGS